MAGYGTTHLTHPCGFRQPIADGVVAEGLDRRDATGHRRRQQPVERIVGEALRQIGGGVGAGGRKGALGLSPRKWERRRNAPCRDEPRKAAQYANATAPYGLDLS